MHLTALHVLPNVHYRTVGLHVRKVVSHLHSLTNKGVWVCPKIMIPSSGQLSLTWSIFLLFGHDTSTVTSVTNIVWPTNVVHTERLFRLQSKLADRAIYFACVNYFLFYLFLMIYRITIISGSTGPIFTIFSPNESVLLQMIGLDLFFRYLKESCHGNQFCKLPSFVTLAFRNWMGYRYLNGRVNSANDACILLSLIHISEPTRPY